MDTVSRPAGGLPPFRLATLGTMALRGPQQTLVAGDGRQQRRRLALLAVLASAGERGRSRDQLLLLFWPDSTEKKARHSLDQLLYAIRTSLDDSFFVGVNPVRLNPAVIEADVCQFESLLAAGDHEAAVSVYQGPFLDGFHPGESLEFQDWLESERRLLGTKYLDALETLAGSAERNGDFANAVRWRRKAVEADPLSTRYAVGLVRTLANSGDFAAALEFASRYERTAKRELGVDGIPELNDLVLEIRSRPSSGRPPNFAPPANDQSAEMARNVPIQTAEQRRKSRFPVATTIGIGVLATALLGAFFYTQPRSDAAPAGNRAVDRAAKGTRNIAAYDLYLRAQDPVLLRNDSTAELGLGYLTKAVELDSGFAAAHAAMSQMYVRLAMGSRVSLPQSELRHRAESSARKAIALDDSLAEGHQALGLTEAFWLDPRTAERELTRALQLNPHLSHTLEFIALVRVYLGKSSEALTDAQRAVAEDPLSPINRAVLAQMLYVNGRCKEALPILDSLGAMKPPLLRVPIARSLCLGSEDRWSEAAESVRAQAARGDRRAMGILGLALARSGKRDEATEIRSRLRAMATENTAALFDVAFVSFGLGELDDALSSLEQAESAGPFPYELLGPLFEPLQRDSRFTKMTSRRGVHTPHTGETSPPT